VAVSGGSLCGARKDYMVEGFGGFATLLTCMRFTSIPRGMSLKVAFIGPHLVNLTRVELIEAHEGVWF